MPEADVMIIEDDAPLREALCESLRAHDLTVCSASDGTEALSVLGNTNVNVIVSDINMEPMDGCQLLSRLRSDHAEIPAVMMTAYGTIEQAVDVMRHGASDFLVKPVEIDTLLEVVNRYLNSEQPGDDIVAEDPGSRQLLKIARRVAATDVTVTISGESGSGKEVIARYIHDQSQRRDKPFIAINCAAIPENMLEAVLFGHEKGAFTGAVAAHAGKFEQAQGGTLLLDEISEMDIGLQAKLLRVIQQREVERIGGKRTIDLDVRVLATTNRDLRQSVSEGHFREDLYYRLHVFPLTLLPLRKRPGDILPLFGRAVRRYHSGNGPVPQLSDEATASLLAHTWPGNVRELENLVQRSLIMQSGPQIDDVDLVFEPPADVAGTTAEAADLQHSLRHREKQVIVDALEQSGGSRKEASEILGISPRTLRYKLARLRKEGMLPPASATTRAI